MKKEQFDKLKHILTNKGYREYLQQLHNEDYILCKGFHKEDNQWEEDRNAYQIIISVYDYTVPNKPYYDRLPSEMKEYIGLEVHVDVSRTVDERLELTFSWHDNETIEQVEYVAEQFYNSMCTIFKKPRE